MIKWFIQNEWRETKRSAVWEQSLGIKIFLGFLFSILFLEILVGAIFLGDKFDTLFPDDDPVEKFNSFILYGFTLGFLTRFMIQKVPVLSVEPYLHLPVKKSFLVHYISAKSLFSFFNFIPVIIFTPFIIFQIAPFYTGFQITGYIFTIIFSTLSVNVLAILFKRNLSGNNWISGIIFLVLVLLGLADHYKIISLGDVSSALFTACLENPGWVVVPFLIFAGAYLINFTTLIHRLYPEENNRLRRKQRKEVSDIKYLKQFGVIGQLMQLEIKLFMRNKRTKSTMVFMPIFLLYGFLFYPQDIYMEMSGMLVFVGAFMTGGFIMLYGQYMLSWESSYFDGILTHIDDFFMYYRAKYYIMVFSSVATFIVTLPYAFYDIKILMINTATFLFNIGISTMYVMTMSTFNKKRLNLDQGSAFNYQGVSATQFLVSFPIMLGPVLIYWPFSAFGAGTAGIIAVGLTGLIAVFFNKSLTNIAVKRFLRNRYVIAEGFRQKL